jgi:hypothetical protein
MFPLTPGVCVSDVTQSKSGDRRLGKSGGGGVIGFDMPVAAICDKLWLYKESVYIQLACGGKWGLRKRTISSFLVRLKVGQEYGGFAPARSIHYARRSHYCSWRVPGKAPKRSRYHQFVSGRGGRWHRRKRGILGRGPNIDCCQWGNRAKGWARTTNVIESKFRGRRSREPFAMVLIWRYMRIWPTDLSGTRVWKGIVNLPLGC